MEISDLTDIEFKISYKDDPQTGRRMDEHRENFSKYIYMRLAKRSHRADEYNN